MTLSSLQKLKPSKAAGGILLKNVGAFLTYNRVTAKNIERMKSRLDNLNLEGGGDV